MKTIVIIPARYKSSRFEGKPLAVIGGKPMIRRVYERAVEAKNVSDVVVATDDQRIMDVVVGFGGRAVMTSDKNRSGTDRAGEAAGILGMAPEDIIINVQGDQPLVNPQCLDQLIKPFSTEKDVEMSTLAFKIKDPKEITNPKDVKLVFDRLGRALYFSRAPIPFGRDAGERFDTYKHLGVYAYTRRFLDKFRSLPEGTLERIEKLEQLRVLEHGYQIRVVVTEYDSPEVDLPEDVLKIEKKL